MQKRKRNTVVADQRAGRAVHGGVAHARDFPRSRYLELNRRARRVLPFAMTVFMLLHLSFCVQLNILDKFAFREAYLARVWGLL